MNVEVEHRGILTEAKFKNLNKFLKKNGKFLGEKDRFSVIYSPRGKETLKVIRSPIDLKLRITNKKTELVLKYGRWSGNDARKEFLFSIDSNKFEEMTEFLKILGFYYGVLQATKTYLYLYKGIEFALVKVPNWGHYFEAEISTDSDSVKKANEKIMSICKELDLSVLNDKDFYKLCESLNKRPGFRFNFKKEKFSDIKKRFISYF
ncbi:MAG: Adenylate cyclase [Berkelbacteria bacterium GW2011_GWA1_36_9]|uniref:Adenylate cyclase n=1 Tax=Berkelbacteria bacterium GW2011_GWA1_36_9 TaxID=1618331 RepID=A0A0G0FL80_9BACT|nr:MAG: Adenylate cyclase [Berkelbacteria bacterium GW2011_GWA1_36_9]